MRRRRTRYGKAGGVRYVPDAKPGYPCRQCLRDAEVGEALLLVAHDAFSDGVNSVCRSRSPIFIHEEPCEVQTAWDDLPYQLTYRQLSVRAFDGDVMMTDAEVIDGAKRQATLERFFADASTHEVHVHNAVRGCWATTVVRG